MSSGISIQLPTSRQSDSTSIPTNCFPPLISIYLYLKFFIYSLREWRNISLRLRREGRGHRGHRHSQVMSPSIPVMYSNQSRELVKTTLYGLKEVRFEWNSPRGRCVIQDALEFDLGKQQAACIYAATGIFSQTQSLAMFN